LKHSEADICLSINLEGNLSVKNKSANCYSDACELAENHASLKAVQIDDSQVIDGLKIAIEKKPSADWKLELLLGGEGAFSYSVKPDMVNGSVLLNVC